MKSHTKENGNWGCFQQLVRVGNILYMLLQTVKEVEVANWKQNIVTFCCCFPSKIASFCLNEIWNTSVSTSLHMYWLLLLSAMFSRIKEKSGKMAESASSTSVTTSFWRRKQVMNICYVTTNLTQLFPSLILRINCFSPFSQEHSRHRFNHLLQ